MVNPEKTHNEEGLNKQEIETCQHNFQDENREWNEPRGARDKSIWHYAAIYKVCKKCGKEVFSYGTIVVPEGEGFIGGEYVMEEDGERGMQISY